MASQVAADSVRKVAACKQNCWMVTTARTAMRSPLISTLPKLGPLAWVIKNKIKVSLGGAIPFDRYINYSNVAQTQQVPRTSYLEEKFRVRHVAGRDSVDKRYPLPEFVNE